MAARGLHSDHINLLVFRYLQEVGFETSANAFHRDWHRHADYHDPEHLPFAREVHRNELVSVIQTGLYHDDLQSRVRRRERRFRWTGIDVHDGVERHNATAESAANSRPPSSNKRKGRPAGMRAPDDTPAFKKPRRSEGSDAHTNGDRDAMDTDAVSPSADADEDGDAPSPALHSESEQAEAMERYDSMDVATQTEIKTSPKTSTMYWKIDKPGASIMHSVWNPDSNPKNARTLLTVGESLCRFYQVPDLMDDARQISHIDEPSLPNGCTVTASAWRPDGQGASCATVGIRDLPDSSNMERQLLVELNRQGGNEILQLGPPLLEPAGVVLALHYSPDQQYLVAARTNGKSSLVQIWNAPQQASESSTKKPLEPIAWRIFETSILDVAWTGDDTFLVCGDNGLSAMYQVDLSQQPDIGTVIAGTVAMRGLISLNSQIIATTTNWDKIRFDSRHKLAVFVSSDERVLCVTPRLYDTTETIKEDVHRDLPETLHALAFKPWSAPEGNFDVPVDFEAPSTLAAAFDDGSCIVYSLSRSSAGARCTETTSISLLDGPALALAWSPSGEHLAVGNAERVQIWTAESLERRNGALTAAQASVIWRPASEAGSRIDGEHDAAQSLPEPSLSWSADGESLAFAADKQIAIVRFRPSLNNDARDVEINGGRSP